jgi:hypothetical protein
MVAILAMARMGGSRKALLVGLQAGDVEPARDDLRAALAVAQRPFGAFLFEPLLEGRQELAHRDAAVVVEQEPPDDERQPGERHQEHGDGEIPVVRDEREKGVHARFPGRSEFAAGRGLKSEGRIPYLPFYSGPNGSARGKGGGASLAHR